MSSENIHCHDVEDLLPVYSLNALEGDDEVSRVEEHLKGCERCSLLMEEYREASALLAGIAPPVEPGRALRARVMRAVGAGQDSSRQRGRWWRSTRLVGTTAACMAVLLLGAVVALQVSLFDQVDELKEDNHALASSVNGLSQENGRLMQTVEGLRQENQVLATRLNDISRDGDRLFDLVSQQAAPLTEVSSAVSTVTTSQSRLRELLERERLLSYMIASQSVSSMPLDGRGGDSDAHGVLSVAGGGRTGILVVAGLEPLPEHQAYQIWLWKDNRPVTGGMFNVDDSGWGTVLFQSEEPIITLAGVSITREPAAGSRIPTGPFMLGASINSQR